MKSLNKYVNYVSFLKVQCVVLVASCGEVIKLQPAEYPSLYKRVQVPDRSRQIPQQHEKPYLEPVFWFVMTKDLLF